MIAAGIKELKVHLSSYIRKVKAGETVQVTEHGHTVAIIKLPGEQSAVEKAIEKMAREGLVIPAKGKPRGGAMKIKLRKGARPTSEIIIEDRRW